MLWNIITTVKFKMQKHPARLNPLLRDVCVGLFLLLLPSFANADESASAAVVEKLHATLIDVMKHAGKLGFQGRYDALAPVIESSFDTQLISQVILSRYWKELPPEQQRQFVAIFNRLSISTYASRFDSYSDESFKTLGVEEMKKGRQLVTSELASGNKKPVKFEYLLQQNGGRWYIISVIADGVNDLALKRAEYATIINDKGFDGLINEMEKKIQGYASTPANN